MTPGTRRLPEDSVVASLSEIQAILQTGEGARPRSAPVVLVRESTAPLSPSTIGAPVPSAAEIRESREARWRDEMTEVRGPATAARPRRFGVLTLWLTGLSLAGGVAAGVLMWPGPTAPPTEAARPAVEAPTDPVADSPPSAALVPSAPSPESLAVAAPGGEAPRVADTAAPRKRAGRATQRHRGAMEAAFGPRSAVRSGRVVQRPKVKRKKTRADSQLDSVLDRL